MPRMKQKNLPRTCVFGFPSTVLQPKEKATITGISRFSFNIERIVIPYETGKFFDVFEIDGIPPCLYEPDYGIPAVLFSPTCSKELTLGPLKGREGKPLSITVRNNSHEPRMFIAAAVGPITKKGK